MRNRFPIVLVALGVGLSASCAQRPKGGKAEMGTPAAHTYAADPVHSSVVFRIKHMDVKNLWRYHANLE